MTTSTHYNGTVELAFDPLKHIYTINGEVAYGVTSALQIIAKPALIWWAASCAGKHIEATLKPGQSLDEMQIKQLAKDAVWAHKNNKDSAADMGTWVHDYLDKYVSGENPDEPINDKLLKAVRSFKRWYDKSNIEPLATELKLCSPTLNLAGTVDFVGMYNGKLTIIDWKTGSGIYPEMLLQMGAYSLMYEEEFGKKIEQIGVVNCSVKSSFGVYFTDEVENAKQMYKSILALAKQLKELEQSMKGGI